MRAAHASRSGGSTDTGTLVTLLGLLLIGAGFVLGMYALTEPGERAGLLASLSPLLVGVVAGVPALLAAMRGEQLRREHGAKLDRIERQTNGELREAVSAIVGEQLDVRGLVPRQREGDPPPMTAGQLSELRAGGEVPS